MSVTEDRPRPDLSALRIHREDDDARRVPWGKIVGWLVALASSSEPQSQSTRCRLCRAARQSSTRSMVKPTVNVSQSRAAHRDRLSRRQQAVEDHAEDLRQSRQLSTSTSATKFRAGDVLAVLESTNMQAQLDEANADTRATPSARTRVSSALWNEGVTSKALLDGARLSSRQARARVEQIRINMQDMVVRAPFDGTIATKNTEVGEVISSVMMGQVGRHAARRRDLHARRSQHARSRRRRQRRRASASCTKGRPRKSASTLSRIRSGSGVLRQIIPTADRAKATVQVKVKIVDPGDRLLPEMSSSVSFLQSERTDAELHEPAEDLAAVHRRSSGGHVAVVGADRCARHVHATGTSPPGAVVEKRM